MEQMPPDLRAKYEQMRTVTDPLTQKPVTDILGGSYWGFREFDNGARRFNFGGGDIASFDHTNRYPIVCVWGPIFSLYSDLGGPGRSALGRPLSDVRALPDGSLCAVFEGGHLHQWADKVEPFPAEQCTASHQPPPAPFAFDIGPNKMPVQFLRKWQELSFQHDPVLGQNLVKALGPIDGQVANIDVGGQRLVFGGGEIVIYDNRAFAVYGPIRKYWTGVRGGWGRPMTDEQDLQDGGRCQVFEGGHIHRYGDIAGPVAPERCTAQYRPVPPPGLQFNKMPPPYQWKWSQLILINNPVTNQPIGLELGGLENAPRDWNSRKGGQSVTFGNGLLGTLSADNRPPQPGTPFELIPPFAVYGGPHKFWSSAGGSTSKFGRPLCDQQALPDGGRCNIFEGGHIHFYNGESREVPAHECRAAHQPHPPHAMPNMPNTPNMPNMPNQPFTPPPQQGYYPPASPPHGYPQQYPEPPRPQPPQMHPQMHPQHPPQQHPQHPPQQHPPHPPQQHPPRPPPQPVRTSRKPIGLIAILIFEIIGWNIEECQVDNDNCFCCCCGCDSDNNNNN